MEQRLSFCEKNVQYVACKAGVEVSPMPMHATAARDGSNASIIYTITLFHFGIFPILFYLSVHISITFVPEIP
jgi:hypothetical protein